MPASAKSWPCLAAVRSAAPDYGMLVHQVFPEKMRPGREMALGICAKRIIVYQVRNASRIATLQFQWWDWDGFHPREGGSGDKDASFSLAFEPLPLQGRMGTWAFPYQMHGVQIACPWTDILMPGGRFRSPAGGWRGSQEAVSSLILPPSHPHPPKGILFPSG